MRSSKKSGQVAAIVLAAGAAVCSGGCAAGPDTRYGMSRGTSLNGTSAFAAVLRDRGYDVHAAIHLNDDLAEWADGIVRFATYPGRPQKEEAEWYRNWLAADRDHWLIYVVRDFDAEPEYWKELEEQLSDPTQEESRLEAQEKRLESADWISRLPKQAAKAAPSEQWFECDSAITPPTVCTKLGGPWAEGIDARAAALPVHEPLKSDKRCILLEGDGKPLVADKSLIGAGRILVIANGSFLLNGALVNMARWPLVERVADWPEGDGRQVALADGSFLMENEDEQTIWALFMRVPALRWVAIQLGLAGLIAALARAPRLGRPRPDPASGADRPAAHAEALGALLARAGAAADAHDLLDRYRLWRHPQTSRELARAPARALARARLGAADASAIAGGAEQAEAAPRSVAGSGRAGAPADSFSAETGR
jgi:hypothetical protein